jgi:hypothetical protein
MNAMVDLPQELIISIISEIDDPDAVHALGCTSMLMRESVNRPDVKASWLLRHRPRDAVRLAALFCEEEVLFRLVDPLWRQQEELSDAGKDMTILQYACFLGHSSVVARVLNHGCRVDQTGYNCQDIFDVPHVTGEFWRCFTAIHLACLAEKTDVVRMLLAHDRARCTSCNRNELAPAIWTACYVGNVQIVDALVEAGADVNFDQDTLDDLCEVERYHELWYVPTHLHAASDRGHVQCVSALLRLGARVDSFIYGDEVLNSPIHVACAKGHVGVVRAYLEHGVTPDDMDDISDGHDMGPLHFACQNGRLGVARLLMDAGCTLNTEDTYGQTPFHTACEYGKVQVARLLFERGCDVDARALDLQQFSKQERDSGFGV